MAVSQFKLVQVADLNKHVSKLYRKMIQIVFSLFREYFSHRKLEVLVVVVLVWKSSNMRGRDFVFRDFKSSSLVLREDILLVSVSRLKTKSFSLHFFFSLVFLLSNSYAIFFNEIAWFVFNGE